MVRIARAYKDAHGVELDLKQSFYWFKRTQDSGAAWVDDEFGRVLPEMYDDSYNVVDPQYWNDLFNALLPYAENKDKNAVTCIARAFRDSHGTQYSDSNVS